VVDGSRLLNVATKVDAAAALSVVQPRGEVDVATTGVLRRALEEQLARGRHVVVDLSQVTFLDAAGITVLLAAETEARRAGCRLTVENPAGIVARVLRITGADAVLVPDR
jgi:anti-sigma B factor antagonist